MFFHAINVCTLPLVPSDLLKIENIIGECSVEKAAKIPGFFFFLQILVKH